MLIVKDRQAGHDYYDTVAKFGVDREHVYNRKQLKYGVNRDWNSLPSINLSLNSDKKPVLYQLDLPTCASDSWDSTNFHNSLEIFYLGFCGDTYKVVNFSKKPHSGKEYVFNKWWYNPTKEDNEEIESSTRRFRHYCPLVDKNKKFDDFKFPLELFTKIDAPVFRLNETNIVTNPILRNINFMQVKDPYSAFTEIEQFISGVLGKKEKNVVDISDEDRLKQHGFDEKFSFRHPVKLK